MNDYFGEEFEINPAFQNGSVVSIGVFDGLHQGHLELIKKNLDFSKKLSIPSVILTFDKNPLEILNPNNAPKNILSLENKIKYLKEMGLDFIYVLQFTKNVANISAKDFIKKYLIDIFNIKTLIVGNNFKFGRKGLGDISLLKDEGIKYGFELIAVDLKFYDDEKVSSSEIRNLLSNGEIHKANLLLGRNFYLTGEVIHGDAIGRTLGFPTANIFPNEKIIKLKDGIYSGWVEIESISNKRFPAAISVGTKPTFDNKELFIEAHLLDFEKDIYGENIKIEFSSFIRPQIKFETVEKLVIQIEEDVSKISKDLFA